MPYSNLQVQAILTEAISLLWDGVGNRLSSDKALGSEYACIVVKQAAANMFNIEYGDAGDLGIVEMLRDKIKARINGALVVEVYLLSLQAPNNQHIIPTPTVQAFRKKMLEDILLEFTEQK